MAGTSEPASAPGRRIRIASRPAEGSPNAYIRLFYRALERHGVELVRGLAIDRGALAREAASLDAIHLHWPEDIWRSRGDGWPSRLRGIAGLVRYLDVARRRGVRLIWTVHEIGHHEGSDLVDLLGYRVLARYADLVICHDGSSRDEAVKRLGVRRETALVMRHGNYRGVFPPPRSREDTLGRYGLDASARTLLCFGHVRRYKGLELAIDAAARLGAGHQLVIVGNPFPASYGDEIRRLAAAHGSVRLVLQRTDDQEAADLFHAADCVLLPYRRITGSGAIWTSLTEGRGVVASDLPYFRGALARGPEAGVLHRPDDAEALAAAVRSFFTLPLERRSAAAQRLADAAGWDDVIAPVASWLHRTFPPPAREPDPFTGSATRSGARSGTR